MFTGVKSAKFGLDFRPKSLWFQNGDNIIGNQKYAEALRIDPRSLQISYSLVPYSYVN